MMFRKNEFFCLFVQESRPKPADFSSCSQGCRKQNFENSRRISWINLNVHQLLCGIYLLRFELSQSPLDIPFGGHSFLIQIP